MVHQLLEFLKKIGQMEDNGIIHIHFLKLYHNHKITHHQLALVIYMDRDTVAQYQDVVMVFLVIFIHQQKNPPYMLNYQKI
ncbi:hypothetical protein EIG16_17295 [Escherichia coli O8:H10]|nr:hypothetical protein [Escherichia coli O8:H10]